MNTLLDDTLVGLVLAAAALYALLALGPKTLRRRAFAGAAALLARAPASLRLGAAAQRLARASGAQAPGACGGCEGCGSNDPSSSGSGEVRVSIASISRSRPKQLQ